MAELFGFRFEKIKDEKGSDKFTPPTPDDGTIDIAGGGRFGVLVGGKGVNVGSEGPTIFGLGVLFVMGGVLVLFGSFVELAVGV